MVRRHGWQLPAHTLQVAAITVFFLLAIAFYIFMAPFLWYNGLVIAAYAVYSPVAFAVFILYVRCTAIDPADPGVINYQHPRKHSENNPSESSLGIVPGPLDIGLSLHPSNPSSLAPSVKGAENKEASMEEGQLQRQRPPRICSCACLCGFLCGWMVAPDDCCRFSDPPQPVVEDEILFCTLCNAEVRRFSKHCRSCDKCVDGFDHHCRWLNNCIGKKNYKTFVALMSTSLMLLIVQFIVGTAVFVRCFVDKQRLMEQVMDKLGNGFTRAPFASVVAVCTIVTLLACIPLVELFSFHIILIKKGMTTYEFVLVERAQPGESSVEDEVTTSTSGSTVPGMSRSSSLGLQQQGGWCTPPRIFVEHQDEAIPHPTSGTLSATVRTEQQNNPQKKKPGNVRISAWRLAKLNKAEATRAAASARNASSILRPVVPRPDLDVLNESDESYTSNSSRHSIVSTEFGTPQKNGDDGRSSMSLSPYKSELPRIRTGREPEVIGAWSKSLGMDLKSSGSHTSSSRSSFFGRHLVDAASKFSASASSVSSAPNKPEPGNSSTFTSHPVDPSGSRVKTSAHPKIPRAIGATLSDGYDASAGDTTDDMRRSGKGRMIFIRESKLSPAGSTSGPSFDTRAANQFRGVSTASRTASRTIQFRGRGISTSVLSAYQSRPSRRPPSSSISSESDVDLDHPDVGPYSTTNQSTGLGISSSQRFPSRHTGNLQVNGPSIFFSSPLMPIGETSRRPPLTNNQPPRPPVPLRSGIPGNPGSASSSRTHSRVNMFPSHSLDPSDRGKPFLNSKCWYRFISTGEAAPERRPYFW